MVIGRGGSPAIPPLPQSDSNSGGESRVKDDIGGCREDGQEHSGLDGPGRDEVAVRNADDNGRRNKEDTMPPMAAMPGHGVLQSRGLPDRVS